MRKDTRIIDRTIITQEFRILVLALLLVAFTILYLMKIFGYWDFSSRYHVRKIICPTQNYDAQLLIDDDIETSWGLIDMPRKGENLEFYFTHPVKISFIDLLLNDKILNSVPYAELKLFRSDNEVDWNEVPFQTSDMRHLVLTSTVSLSCLRIQYCGDESGHWGISEVNFR